jgi:hypothetical protein
LILSCLLEFADRVLGTCELEADCSWAHGMSSVLRVRDANGASWFVKRHGDQARYGAELAAYREWIPALQDAAPRLRAFDDRLHALIISAVPAAPPPWPAAEATGPLADRRAERDVQRDAGKVLRRLHDVQPPMPWPDFAAAKIQQFERLRPAAAALLKPRELDEAGTQIAALNQVPAPPRVPCHHDYTPRNWLVGNGALYVIDFELSGLDAPAADLARLHLGVWASRPDLREAFLDGYGQELSVPDRQVLHGCAVLTAVWLVVRAHETRQALFEEAIRQALRRTLDHAL